MSPHTDPYDYEIIRPRCVLVVSIEGTIFYASFEDDPAAKGFIDKLNPRSIDVVLTGEGAERCGTLPFEIPCEEKETEVRPGDIVLRDGGGISLFLEGVAASGVRIARLGDSRINELADAFGNESRTVLLSLEWGE